MLKAVVKVSLALIEALAPMQARSGHSYFVAFAENQLIAPQRLQRWQYTEDRRAKKND
jgi:hypothetical protein